MPALFIGLVTSAQPHDIIMMMKFIPQTIPDVILVEPVAHEDDRGFFLESFREDLFTKNGIPSRFVQDNHSRSNTGIVRGLHFQIPPKAQGKLLRVIAGEIFDVAVDIRKGSKTYGKSVTCLLNAVNKHLLYVPPGFAHGFCVLQDNTEVLYKVSELYSPADERGLLWSDSALNIQWPQLDTAYVLSERDQKHPLLKDLKPFFQLISS